MPSRSEGTSQTLQRLDVAEILSPAIRTAVADMDGRVAQMLRLVTATWPALDAEEGTGPEGRCRGLIKLFEQEAADAPDDEAGRLLEGVARIYEEDLGDRGSAAKAILQSLRRNPSSCSARRIAVRLLMDAESSDLFAGIVDELARMIDSLPERNAMLLDYALHEEFRRGHGGRATEVYRRVLAEESGNMEAAEGLLRLLLRDHAWRDLASLCRNLACREEDGEMRATLELLAALLADDRPVKERALWVAHAASFRSDARLALPMAVGLFRAAGDTESAIRIQLERTGSQSPDVGRLHFQASWMFAQQEHRRAEALEHAEKAREQDPDNILYLAWVCELYESEARWNELAEALEHKAKVDTTREEWLETLFQLADVLTDRLGQPERAVAFLEKALSVSPTDLACLQALGRLYARLGRWEQLVRMHLQEASVTEEPSRRANALYAAARLIDRELDRSEEAIAHLEQAVDLHPSHTPAVRLLEQLYRRMERFADLVRLYRQELAAETRRERKAALLEQIGELLESQLGDTAGAVAAYEHLLDLVPDSPVSLRALTRLYEEERELGKLLSVLRAQAMHAGADEERAALLLRMGQVLEDELGNAAQALAHYRESLAVAPSDQAFEHVGRLLHALKRWQELLGLTDQQLALTKASSQRVRLLFRLGWLYERQLHDPEAAAAAYQQVLELDTGHWPALRALTRVAHHLPDLRRLGLESMLLEQLSDRQTRSNAQIRIALSLLQQQRSAAKEILQRAVAEDEHNAMARDVLLQLLVEDGQWHEVAALADPIEAISVAIGGQFNLDEALRISREESERRPDSLCALRWLELLQSAVDEPQRVAPVLARRAEKETDPPRRLALLLRLAHWIQNIEAAEGDAAAVFRQLLAEQPGELRALDGLERLARLREDQDLIQDVLQRREQLVANPSDLADTLAARGQLLERFGHTEEAIEPWRRALEADAHCRLAYEGIKRAYGTAGDSAGLLWALERSAHFVRQPIVRTRDLLRRADLHAQAGSADWALDDLELILREDPAQLNALERLERLFKERGEPWRLADRLAAAVKAAKLPACRAALLVKLALLFRDELRDLRRASDLLNDAIEADPDNVAALLVAADVRRRLDQPTEAVSLLNRVVLRSEDHRELIGAHLTLAHLFIDVVGDVERARRSLKAVLELDEANVAALDRLADLAEQQLQFGDPEPYLRKLLEQQEDATRRAGYAARLARFLFERHGTGASEVATLLDEALATKPDEAALLELAIAVYTASSQWEKLDAALARGIPLVSERARARLLLARAEVLSRQLDKRDEAREVLRELVRSDAGGDEAVELLLEHMDDVDLSDPDLREESIRIHRRLLDEDPSLVTSIRRLAMLFEAAGRADEAFYAQSVLIFIGQASEEEVYFYKRRRGLLSLPGSCCLEPEQVTALVMPSGEHPARQVLCRVKRYLPALMPPDLTQYGCQSLEAIEVGQEHPARRVVDDCRRLLALQPVRVCEALGGAPDGATEPGAQSTVVLPRDFARYPVPQQRFLCGRMLARVASDTECCDLGRADPLTRRDLEILMAAIVRSGDPGFGEAIAAVAILDDLVARLRQVAPAEELDEVRSKARDALDADGAREALDEWLVACELGTMRAGLICSGGLDSISAWIERQNRPLSDSMVRGLVQFTLSEQFAEYRRQTATRASPHTGERGDGCEQE